MADREPRHSEEDDDALRGESEERIRSIAPDEDEDVDTEDDLDDDESEGGRSF
ncbi:MAG TPA: hypothetical protein VH458_08500 [Vicinamibacterales bacterium]|jgi:hypothetical protein